MVASPLGAARARRRLTLEEAAARAELDPEAVRSLEESRVYRFESPQAALAATLLYATALGISRREARQLAGLPVGSRLVEALGAWRLAALAALAAACAAVAWFAVVPNLGSDRPAVAAATPSASADVALPQPWEIRVDVYNGTDRGRAATLLANAIAGLAYRVGSVERAPDTGYRQTRVYYPPGAREIAQRLARQLGVGTTALPGGDDPLRLVVIAGADRAG
jgi:hypothetical protein